ncbi:MAG: hypothetical protein ACRC7V_00855 [Lachnospiraceae bacterium]
MKNKKYTTVLELCFGILLFSLVVQIIGFLVVDEIAYYSIGLWLGSFVALLSAFHMWWALDRALDLGKEAQKFLLSNNMARYGLIVISFAVFCVIDIGNPLASFIGIMSLKVGAYLQPFTHKIFFKDGNAL